MLLTTLENYTITCGEQLIELELGEPSAQAQEIALRELRETPEIKEAAIAELKILLLAETDLYCPMHSDDWLVSFLRPCKFYPTSARDLIKRHYKFKLKNAFLCEGLVPSKVPNLFHSNVITVLFDRDQLGRRIVLMRLGKLWKINEINMDEIFKGSMLFFEMALTEANTQINGAIAIFDLEGFSFKHVLQFTPAVVKRLLDYLQESIPIRLKAAHIVNNPKVFDLAFAIFKRFLNEKLRNRIYFHGKNFESLHQYISPECLPPLYGGSSETPIVEGSQAYNFFAHFEKEFELKNSYGYNQ